MSWAGASDGRWRYAVSGNARTHLAIPDDRTKLVNGFKLTEQRAHKTACGRDIGRDSDMVPKGRVTEVFADVDCKNCQKKLPTSAMERLS